MLHFAYRGSSHRRKGAVRGVIGLVWLYRSPASAEKGGILLVEMVSTSVPDL